MQALRRPFTVASRCRAVARPFSDFYKRHILPDVDNDTEWTSAQSRGRNLKHKLENLQREQKEAAGWATLLEPALPPHLRQHELIESNGTTDVADVGAMLVAAQRSHSTAHGIDLLSYLALEQGRWAAVTWLVKQLVEVFGPQHKKSNGVSQAISDWKHPEILDELTRDAITLPLPGEDNSRSLAIPVTSTLDELMANRVLEKLPRIERLSHNVLGQVWRSLGKMSISCAGGTIKTEILELIAYLHHKELMPTTIYNQKPFPDATIIQQPPIINLFSSRILSCLSDAAWRAHEKITAAETKPKGGVYDFLYQQVPGMANRIGVTGLRPELWLELILWACLHGGWIEEGLAILNVVYTETGSSSWKPVSWRALMDSGESKDDWNNLEYLFKTGVPFVPEAERMPRSVSRVQRTVSNEVINAYVDAVLTQLQLDVGARRGRSPKVVLSHLTAMKKFLGRAGLSLSSGSWDAVLLRVFESAESIVDENDNFHAFTSLASSINSSISSPRDKHLPAYVFDGSAMIIGLYHRAIWSSIEAGNIDRALRLFAGLQNWTDTNKKTSLADLLMKRQRGSRDESSVPSGLFTSNFPGIEYPAFETQVPPTILGPFLERVIDARAYRFGKWLLYSDEVDGPLIPARLYTDPAITPALIRFATETNDMQLLSRVLGSRSRGGTEQEPEHSGAVLRSFFDSQVTLKRWTAANRVLQHLSNTPGSHWTATNLAHVVRVMLLQVREASVGVKAASADLYQARKLFTKMIGDSSLLAAEVQAARVRGAPDEHLAHSLTQIALVPWIMSTINATWSGFCSDLRSTRRWHNFTLSTQSFNLILEGVVDAYGSARGRGLLTTWPVLFVHNESTATPRFRPMALEAPKKQKTNIDVPDAVTPLKLVIYGALTPDLLTYRIVLRKALQEYKEALDQNLDYDPDTIGWARSCLYQKATTDEHFDDESAKVLSPREVRTLRDRLDDDFLRKGIKKLSVHGRQDSLDRPQFA